jgi:Pyruvate/2-oxoacid:ferredoxin oxidoreductase gamma subunit
VYTDKESVFLSNSIDIFVYFDDYALEKNEKVFQIKNKIFLSAEKNINLNIFAAGVIFYNLKVPFSVAKKIVEEYFSYKKLSQEILEKNITSLKLAYEREKKLELNFQIEIDNNFQPVLRDGNKTVAEGALTG